MNIPSRNSGFRSEMKCSISRQMSLLHQQNLEEGIKPERRQAGVWDL